MITRVAIESDINEILELQSRNLYTNLSEAERAEGFVTRVKLLSIIRSSMVQYVLIKPCGAAASFLSYLRPYVLVSLRDFRSV